jgi:hypothetical protein
MRFLLLCGLVCLLLPATARAGMTVSAFYYPWYGTPTADGTFQHWSQDGKLPPRSIASNYWPKRGVYSSSDQAVLAAQMKEIKRAGITDVAVSWWGWGSPEDQRLPAVIRAAHKVDLTVSVHIEPYGERSVANVEDAIGHLEAMGVTTFYLYRPQDQGWAEWAPMNDRLEDVRVFAQTGLVGQALAGHFDGVYTYDVLIYGGESFPRICQQAHAVGLLCAPSVGPGYDARAAVGDMRVKSRRDGVTYDSMWQGALAANADLVTITSYNEWHEGTQIEPAKNRAGYDTYVGAWGLKGGRAATAYLDHTAIWSRLYAISLALKRGTEMLAP